MRSGNVWLAVVQEQVRVQLFIFLSHFNIL